MVDSQSSSVGIDLLKGDGTRERLSLPPSLSGKDVSLRQAIQRRGDVPLAVFPYNTRRSCDARPVPPV